MTDDAKGRAVIVGLLAVTLLFGCGGCFGLYMASQDHVTAIVTKRERVTFGAGDSARQRYLVFTEGETFQVADSMLFGNFRSADLYGRLAEGKKFRLRVVGWRLPFFSQYRNIIEAKDAL